MKTYEIQIGSTWYKVRGIVNSKGWLEWKDNEGCQGLKAPGTFREPQPRPKK